MHLGTWWLMMHELLWGPWCIGNNRQGKLSVSLTIFWYINIYMYFIIYIIYIYLCNIYIYIYIYKRNYLSLKPKIFRLLTILFIIKLHVYNFMKIFKIILVWCKYKWTPHFVQYFFAFSFSLLSFVCSLLSQMILMKRTNY